MRFSVTARKMKYFSFLWSRSDKCLFFWWIYGNPDSGSTFTYYLKIGAVSSEGKPCQITLQLTRKTPISKFLQDYDNVLEEQWREGNERRVYYRCHATWNLKLSLGTTFCPQPPVTVTHVNSVDVVATCSTKMPNVRGTNLPSFGARVMVHSWNLLW